MTKMLRIQGQNSSIQHRFRRRICLVFPAAVSLLARFRFFSPAILPNRKATSLPHQIFTKIIEYFSPVEIERKNCADFANRNVPGLVEHALSELENLSEHHNIDLQNTEPEMLYLFTKIERIKERLLQLNRQPFIE